MLLACFCPAGNMRVGGVDENIGTFDWKEEQGDGEPALVSTSCIKELRVVQ